MIPWPLPLPLPWVALAHPSLKLISAYPLPQLNLLPMPPTNAFAPLIERSRNLLTGWRGKLFDKGDRLILISAVLNSLLTYFMSVFRIPKKTLKVIDSLRRAFFWQGTMLIQELNALLHGKMFAYQKKIGGLGLKNLHVQNNCLLMKFAAKALSSAQTPWLEWLDLQHPNALVSSSPQNLLSLPHNCTANPHPTDYLICATKKRLTYIFLA